MRHGIELWLCGYGFTGCSAFPATKAVLPTGSGLPLDLLALPYEVLTTKLQGKEGFCIPVHIADRN